MDYPSKKKEKFKEKEKLIGWRLIFLGSSGNYSHLRGTTGRDAIDIVFIKNQILYLWLKFLLKSLRLLFSASMKVIIFH